ncbi:MAG: anti-sigma regulatory factor [Tannerellaceae bacterium]
MQFKFELEGGNFTKAGYASSEIKKVLKQLSIDSKIIKRIVVALYEAEVNVVAHAWRGIVMVDLDSSRIQITLADEGPGIPDIAQAMKEGYSTASETVREMGFGAGMGLPNMKKNVDELTIESRVGIGTTVCMTTRFSKE